MTQATHIGTVAGIRFFEDPEFNDEAPLMVLSNGELVPSVFWDMPDMRELEGLRVVDILHACRAIDAPHINRGE